MTTMTEAATVVVLRRGKLDARDRAILAAIWERSRPFGGTSIRAVVEASGNKLFSTYYRLVQRGERSLIDQGWAAWDRLDARSSLRPGPRLAGVDNGWPLELVEDAD